MSLLDDSPKAKYEPILIFHEEVGEDGDGNTVTRPSENGTPARARFQVMGQSGTSSRRQEQDNEGFESEKVYSMRFPRGAHVVLGAQAQIEWRGKRWAVFGDANIYNSSPRTEHEWYTVKRY